MKHRLISDLLLICVLLVAVALPVSAIQTQPAVAMSSRGGTGQSAPPDPQAATGVDLAQWYSTQLHIHAWSNHNAAYYPASMQLHSDWARDVGLDVIWWADHNPTFDQVADMPIGLADATIDPTTLDVSIPLPPGTPYWAVYNYVTLLRASVSNGGQAAASLNNGLLQMQVQANADQSFDRFEYRTLTTNGFKIQGLSFTRPLASDPVLSFDATRCDGGGSDSYGQVRVALSWHDYGQRVAQDLVYRLVPADQPGSIVQSSTRVTVTVPLTTTRVNLPLLNHARLLPDGDDNIIQEMYFTVGAKNGAQACMSVGNFLIHSRSAHPEQIYQAHQQMAARHQTTYGVTQLTTWEQFSGVRHLNPYLPSTSTLLPTVNDIQVQVFAPSIHAENGLVMLNHPFGAWNGPALPDDQQEAQVQSLLATMLPVQAWNVELIEIYRLRAQVDLAHHLELWDLLRANGIPVCATATSDAHGAPFNENHSMVTWINAASPTRDDLIAGLRNCRAFFGDLYLFDGILDLQLGSVPVGGVYPVRPGMQPLSITLDPLPPGAQVKLVQMQLQPGTQLTYLVDHQVVDPTQPVLIDVSQPSLVRVEVWSADGQPMVFSNHITVQTLACDVNSSGQTDIVDVQLVAKDFGRSVPPAPTRYDLRRDGRIDLWDVMAVGECWLARNQP